MSISVMYWLCQDSCIAILSHLLNTSGGGEH